MKKSVADSGYFKIPEVYILRSEIEFIEKIVKSSDPRLETGGFLFGKRINGKIVIIKATDAGPKAERYPAEFAPDFEYGQEILNRYRINYDVYWIGTWHKHPDYLNRPSAGDIRQMEQFINDKDMLDYFIALIVTMEIGDININMFYMDESKRLHPINFEIIEKDDPILKELRKRQTRRDTIEYIHKCKEPIKKHFPQESLPPFISTPWYETPEGKTRLKNEINEIRRLPFVNNIEVFKGDFFLTIKVHIFNYPYIMFICPPEYPLNPPTIVFSEEYKEFESCYIHGWNSLTMLSDILSKIVNDAKAIKELEQKSVQIKPKTLIRSKVNKFDDKEHDKKSLRRLLRRGDR